MHGSTHQCFRRLFVENQKKEMERKAKRRNRTPKNRTSEQETFLKEKKKSKAGLGLSPSGLGKFVVGEKGKKGQEFKKEIERREGRGINLSYPAVFREAYENLSPREEQEKARKEARNMRVCLPVRYLLIFVRGFPKSLIGICEKSFFPVLILIPLS